MTKYDGKIGAEINEIERILKKLNLLEERNYYPSKDFDAAEYRNKTYTENWKSLLSSNIYDFILTDNSLIHFKSDNRSSKVSYNFFECPINCASYSEFVFENDLLEDKEEKMFSEYYEAYLNSCLPKENSLMMRYDYDADAYMHGIHPVSHMHIGVKNQIRIAIDKVLSPLNFFAFLLRQHYTGHWKVLIKDEGWLKKYRSFKSNCPSVLTAYWAELDKLELFLG